MLVLVLVLVVALVGEDFALAPPEPPHAATSGDRRTQAKITAAGRARRAARSGAPIIRIRPLMQRAGPNMILDFDSVLPARFPQID